MESLADAQLVATIAHHLGWTIGHSGSRADPDRVMRKGEARVCERHDHRSAEAAKCAAGRSASGTAPALMGSRDVLMAAFEAHLPGLHPRHCGGAASHARAGPRCRRPENRGGRGDAFNAPLPGQTSQCDPRSRITDPAAEVRRIGTKAAERRATFRTVGDMPEPLSHTAVSTLVVTTLLPSTISLAAPSHSDSCPIRRIAPGAPGLPVGRRGSGRAVRGSSHSG
jgi:hypothetical protein